MTLRGTEGRGTALVTGASTGIGLELAKVLASSGHPLVIVARSAGRLKELAAKVHRDYGVPVSGYAKDLAEPGAANELWAELSKSNITVEVLVNNAGVGLYGEFHEESPEALQRMQIVNVLALRGDPPDSGEFKKTPGGFEFASELVEFIRAQNNFSVGVAGFPEGHIANKTGKHDDWRHLKEKVDAGDDR